MKIRLSLCTTIITIHVSKLKIWKICFSHIFVLIFSGGRRERNCKCESNSCTELGGKYCNPKSSLCSNCTRTPDRCCCDVPGKRCKKHIHSIVILCNSALDFDVTQPTMHIEVNISLLEEKKNSGTRYRCHVINTAYSCLLFH